MLVQPQHDSCPIATQNLSINTKRRDRAIRTDWIQYGPINLADEQFWVRLGKFWRTTAPVAKRSRCANCVAFDISPRMLACMPGPVDGEGRLGYCWMHQFKCHSARTCRTWAAGGPIEKDAVSREWQARAGG